MTTMTVRCKVKELGRRLSGGLAGPLLKEGLNTFELESLFNNERRTIMAAVKDGIADVVDPPASAVVPKADPPPPTQPEPKRMKKRRVVKKPGDS